ncbi:sporulation histidine kinase inhibitor Sda [Alkalihalobacillus deserti]|uniref:sporulation histidine kinase inhibitor Sda n=1 Tax=Alkalihalobacillus deserti TaxID=2879466 RepID=UPI001D14FBB8|nr:sporulation histidine kinase inhibitor Sda [Alkalihalobacillus deserti]
MLKLSEKLLLESYKKAIELNVNQEFLILLEKEILRRGVSSSKVGKHVHKEAQ